jgi:hypothetical protein
MGRSLAVKSCAAVACALLGGSTAFGSVVRGDAASASSRQLVFMQQVRPVTITPQSVSVDANGDAAVIVVLGELTIPKPVRFHLDSHALAQLRHLLHEADLPALHIEAPIPFRALMYTVRSGGHEVRVVEGHVPVQMRGLVNFLHGLINRHI